MSRLDIVTILIVAFCVSALAVLIYRVVKLTSNDETAIEATEERDKYDEYFNDEETTTAALDDAAAFDDEGELVEDDTTEDAIPAASATEESEEVVATTSEEDSSSDDSNEVANEPVDSEETVEPEEYDEEVALGSNEGDYMVIAGTYAEKSNAEVLVKKLKDAGYTNAGMHLFDRKKFNVVIADRYDELAQARAAVRELKKAHGIAAYVKKK